MNIKQQEIAPLTAFFRFVLVICVVQTNRVGKNQARKINIICTIQKKVDQITKYRITSIFHFTAIYYFKIPGMECAVTLMTSHTHTHTHTHTRQISLSTSKEKKCLFPWLTPEGHLHFQQDFLACCFQNDWLPKYYSLTKVKMSLPIKQRQI